MIDLDTCQRGHEFSPENTYVTPTGHRNCKRCIKLRAYYNAAGRSAPRPSPYGPVATLVVGALRTHPQGLELARIRAILGYRQTEDTLRVIIYDLRHRRGLAITGTYEGTGRRRYVLEGAA